MAFGTNSTKPVFTRYTGIGKAKIVGVNPSMKEINDAFGRQIYTSEPEYLRDVDYDGKTYKQSRVTFLLKFEAKDNNGYADLHFFTIPITNRAVTNADGSKVQVIDEFGRTAWVTKAQYDAKQIPMYSNGPARITNKYHAVLRGEEKLINFISAVLATPNIDVYDKDTEKWIKNPRESEDNCKREIPPEDMKLILLGDFSPIRDKYLRDDKGNLVDNIVQVLLGIRTDNDGRKYSTIYDGAFMTMFQSKTSNIEKALKEDKDRGRFADTIFKVGPLTAEEDVKPDDLSSPLASSISQPSASGFDPLGDLPF